MLNSIPISLRGIKSGAILILSNPAIIIKHSPVPRNNKAISSIYVVSSDLRESCMFYNRGECLHTFFLEKSVKKRYRCL